MKVFRFSTIYLILLISILAPGLCPAEETIQPSPTPCDIHQGACKQPLSGGTGAVTLDITPKPVKAMADLTFRVHFSDISLKALPYIDLGMPGMKMGPNRVELKKTPDGTYIGNGIIVRCPSGKTLWQATIVAPDAGTAEFIFNVVY